MSLIRITNGFDREADAKLLERAGFIHKQMAGNANFPSPSPAMPVLLQAIDTLRSAMQAAGNGDRLMIAQKNVARTALVDALHLLGYYVLYASGGDVVKAQSSGYTLAKDKAPQPQLQKPANLTVQVSNQSGELTVKVKKVQGALAYMHQYSTDPLLADESWQTNTCTQVQCKLTGLTPGTTYYLRVGAVGPKDQLLFSDVVSKIAA